MTSKARISGVSAAIQKTLAHGIQNNDQANSTSKGLKVKIANTKHEREAAYKLAYEEYLKKGYTSKKSSKLLIYPYDYDPTTTVFIGKDTDDKVIATATLVFNKTCTLPVKKIFNDELEILSNGGENLVEVARLVINSSSNKSKEVLVQLFNHMFVYGYRVRNFDFTVIQVNPRHINYYKKLLHFETIGAEKPCPSANNAPAILLYLPLPYYSLATHSNDESTVSNKSRSLYTHFLNKEQEDLLTVELRNQATPISCEEKKFFRLKEKRNFNYFNLISSLKNKVFKEKCEAEAFQSI